VVGVVPNIMQGDPTRREFKPLVYLPFRQAPTVLGVNFIVRTGVPPGQVAQAVRLEIEKVDPDEILKKLTTLKASFGFDPNRMDRGHSEMGKYAAVAPRWHGLRVGVSGSLTRHWNRILIFFWRSSIRRHTQIFAGSAWIH
jgi:hypothetical protein